MALSFAAALSLAACGGGKEVSTAASAADPASFAALAAVAPTDEVPEVVVAPTTEEILDSMKTPSGLFVSANTEETVKAAPGQGYVTLLSFSRTEKFRDGYGFSLQPVTQLVFMNRSKTNVADVMYAWDIVLKYGYQDMYSDAPYYVEMWKTEKGSGVTVTFYNGWYGQIPATGLGLPFRLEGFIKNTAVAGDTIALELIHVRTAKVSADYEVDSEAPLRTIVIDPEYVPEDSGKG